jgi:transcriptional regulator with XRE-family HTH domain
LHHRRVEKSVFTPAYAVLRQMLVAVRKAAGLSQRDLAKRLGRERSFVARVEQGERRVDVVELLWICQACGADPRMVLKPVLRAARKTPGVVGRPLRPERARLSSRR